MLFARYVIVDLLKAKWNSYIKKSFFRHLIVFISTNSKLVSSKRIISKNKYHIVTGSSLHSLFTSASPRLLSHCGITRWNFFASLWTVCGDWFIDQLNLIIYKLPTINISQETQYDCPANETISNSTLFNSTSMNTTDNLEMVSEFYIV